MGGRGAGAHGSRACFGAALGVRLLRPVPSRARGPTVSTMPRWRRQARSGLSHPPETTRGDRCAAVGTPRPCAIACFRGSCRARRVAHRSHWHGGMRFVALVVAVAGASILVGGCSGAIAPFGTHGDAGTDGPGPDSPISATTASTVDASRRLPTTAVLARRVPPRSRPWRSVLAGVARVRVRQLAVPGLRRNHAVQLRLLGHRLRSRRLLPHGPESRGLPRFAGRRERRRRDVLDGGA